MANNNTQSLKIRSNEDIADILTNLASDLEDAGNPVTSWLTGNNAEAAEKASGPMETLGTVSNILMDIADRLRELQPTEAWKPRLVVSGLREGDQVIPRFATLASRECAQELSEDEFAKEGGKEFEQFTLELK
jgi:hypothetical protein